MSKSFASVRIPAVQYLGQLSVSACLSCDDSGGRSWELSPCISVPCDLALEGHREGPCVPVPFCDGCAGTGWVLAGPAPMVAFALPLLQAVCRAEGAGLGEDPSPGVLAVLAVAVAAVRPTVTW